MISIYAFVIPGFRIWTPSAYIIKLIKFIIELCDNTPHPLWCLLHLHCRSRHPRQINIDEKKYILYFVKSLQLLVSVSICIWIMFCRSLHWWNTSYKCINNLLRFYLGSIKNIICIFFMNNYIVFHENGEQQFNCKNNFLKLIFLKQENRTDHFIECQRT